MGPHKTERASSLWLHACCASGSPDPSGNCKPAAIDLYGPIRESLGLLHACRSLTVTCMHCPATPCSGSPPGCILSRAASHAGPPCPPSTSSTLPKAVTARPARRDILRPAQEHRVQRGGSSLGTFIVTSEAGPDVSVTVSSLRACPSLSFIVAVTVP